MWQAKPGIVKLLLVILFFLFRATTLYACSDLLTLVEDDSGPLGTKMPLILIHGIHGIPTGRTLSDGDTDENGREY